MRNRGALVLCAVVVASLVAMALGSSGSASYVFPRYARAIKHMSKDDVFQELGINPRDKVSLPAEVEGVRWIYAPSGAALPLNALDPRMALFVVRLSEMARANGIREIRHLGFLREEEGAHHEGRAVDLEGFRLGDGVTKVTVKRNWSHPFFRAIYDFASREMTDRHPDPERDAPPTHLGEPSYILTPSHPTAKYAASHNDHMHVQIGPTGPESGKLSS